MNPLYINELCHYICEYITINDLCNVRSLSKSMNICADVIFFSKIIINFNKHNYDDLINKIMQCNDKKNIN
jgi:hypothetical protein